MQDTYQHPGAYVAILPFRVCAMVVVGYSASMGGVGAGAYY
jgi:hypothetical protein